MPKPISEEVKENVRSDSAAGARIVDIAKTHSISTATVHRILSSPSKKVASPKKRRVKTLLVGPIDVLPQSSKQVLIVQGDSDVVASCLHALSQIIGGR